jgi:hypothetical protein
MTKSKGQKGMPMEVKPKAATQTAPKPATSRPSGVGMPGKAKERYGHMKGVKI